MANRLAHLHSQLRRLRVGRRLYRWGAAWSAVLAAAVGVLLVLLAVDVVFEAGVAARVVMLAIAAAAVIAVLWRLARPWLFVHESELDMALLVERRMGRPGRSDLAAALQFERPDAVAWGSPQLEQAVIERVDTETRGVNAFAGASATPLLRRVAILLAIVAIAAVVAMLWPQHVAVFFQRMTLGAEHYPTKTALSQVVVNGNIVLAADSSLSAPATARCAEGEPLWIAVYSAGELPAEGKVEVASRAGGQRRTLPLVRLDEETATAGADPNPVRREMFMAIEGHRPGDAAVYLAELDRLMEPLDYQIFLGDAWTDPAAIVMVPLPVVEPKITVIAPDYARQGDSPASPITGARQISVLEGSRIELEIAAVNDKPLAEATLRITRGEEQSEFPLTPAGEERLRWTLDAEASPLADVTEEFRYVVNVRDEDGLRPAAPIAGVVRIRPDRPPRVAARLVTRVVLPGAAPVVNLDLSDDYGVERPTVELRITREDGAEETRTLTDLPFHEYNSEEDRLASATAAFPLMGERLPWRGGCRIDLAPLRLNKGDRVAAVFLVTDYRGEASSRSAEAASQPLELEVSDEAGVYRAALEADRQALEDITEAADLQQQLLNTDD